MSSNKNSWCFAFVAGPDLIGAAYGISSVLTGGQSAGERFHRYVHCIPVIALCRRAYRIRGCAPYPLRHSQGPHQTLIMVFATPWILSNST